MISSAILSNSWVQEFTMLADRRCLACGRGATKQVDSKVPFTIRFEAATIYDSPCWAYHH